MIVRAIFVAVVAFTAARLARSVATSDLGATQVDSPYAPSPPAAPFVSLAYREAAADLLFIRLNGFIGAPQATAEDIGSLAEAVAALDPHYPRIFEYGANAMTIAPNGITQTTYLRAIALLDRGMIEAPDDWHIPFLAGEIYTQDLVTTDPAQRRAWDERGTLLIESAIRKPKAPVGAATWAAFMRTKLGQHDRAVEGLREMLLVITDDAARKKITDKLAELDDVNADEIAAEVYEQRHKFEAAWQRDRPTIRPTMYVLLGARLTSGFDLTDLATGGADLVGSAPIERLEPLD